MVLHEMTRPVGRRPGRPTREEVPIRQEQLLDTATRLFMERGYDGTTMNGVAAEAGVSKRTLYARYPDKTSLFAASLRREIDRVLEPLSGVAASADDFEPSLVSIAMQLMAHSIAPVSVALFRIVNAHAARFPEFVTLVTQRGREPLKRRIAAAIGSQAERLRVTDIEGAADVFVALTIDSFLARAMAGLAIGQAELEASARRAVDIFLRGVLR